MPSFFTLFLAPLVVLAAGSSEGAVPTCEQDAESSAVLLLQQDVRVQSRDRVEVGIGPESFEAAPAMYEAVPVEAKVDDHEANEAEEHDTDMSVLQTGFNVNSNKTRTVGKRTVKKVAKAASAEVTYNSATVYVPSPLDNALVEVRHIEEEESAEVDTSYEQPDLSLAAAAAHTTEKQGGVSLLETFHTTRASLGTFAGRAARVVSPNAGEAVSLILMMALIVLLAAVVACLMAGQRSSDSAQGQRLLQGGPRTPKGFSKPDGNWQLPAHPQPPVVQRGSTGSVPRGSTGQLPPTSGASLSMSRPSMEQAPAAPPPICPSLILPHTEARFMISMESLVNMTTGTLDILGTSGRKLLHGSVGDMGDGRRSLVLASMGCEDDPRTRAMTMPGAAGVELFGRLGKFYGTLQNDASGGLFLMCDGRSVMTLITNSQADLAITARTADGRDLASASRSPGLGGGQGGGDVWKLQVKAGVDAVLVTTCMLSRILLLPWPSARPSMMQVPSSSQRGSM